MTVIRRGRSRLSPTIPFRESRACPDPFCAEARGVIHAIPRGRVATYGQVARLAGKPWGARQVAWILHAQSGRYSLPWQRVIGASGRISLPPGRGLEEQRRLLRLEGVAVSAAGRIDLEKFGWSGGRFAGGQKKRTGRAGPFFF